MICSIGIVTYVVGFSEQDKLYYQILIYVYHFSWFNNWNIWLFYLLFKQQKLAVQKIVNLLHRKKGTLLKNTFDLSTRYSGE